MANIIYNIGFKTDASNIQSQLATIQKDIEQAFKRGGSALNAELTEGVKQASILSNVLQKAQTEKGTSFINMNKALMQAGSSASQMVAALSGAGMKQSLNTFLQTFASADRNLIGINSKIKEMMRVLTQSVKFNFAMGLQNFVIGQIQGAVAWSRELNKALTDIAVVSPEVANRLDQVGESIIRNSRALRVSAQDYAEAALIFYQQGLDPAEVERRTEITIKAAMASGQAVQEMSEQLTAVWNTYQMQGDELERAASVAAKLGAETAAAFEDIAVGMQIAASGASILGVSYDSLAAIMATVRETTLQSASTIGNAYKTIFARFSNLKTTGEDAGESLGRITQQLADMGVNVLDASGELRDLDDVILQLGTSWDNYGRKQQIAIAQVVGGVRQYQQFIALMENFDKYQKNLASAQAEVDGSELARQYMETLKSVDSAITNSTEAWRRAFAQVFTDESQLAFYRALEDIGNVVGSIIEGFGGLSGILTVVGAILLTKIAPVVRDILFGIKQWGQNLTLGGQFKAIEKEAGQMQGALEALARQGINTDADQQKLKLMTESSKQQAVLNRLISTGNAETKIRAQYLKEQVEAAQATGNAALDELDTIQKSNEMLRTKLQLQQDILQEEAAPVLMEEDETADLEAAKAAMEQAYAEAQTTIELQKQMELDYQSIAIAEERVVQAEARKQQLIDSGKYTQQDIDAMDEIIAKEQDRVKTAKDVVAAHTKTIAQAKAEAQAAKQNLDVRRQTLKEFQAILIAEGKLVAGEGKKQQAFKTSNKLLEMMSKHAEGITRGLTSAELGQDLSNALKDLYDNIDLSIEGGETLKDTLGAAMGELESGTDPGQVFEQLAASMREVNSEAGISEETIRAIQEQMQNTGQSVSDFNESQTQLQRNQELVDAALQNSKMSLTQYAQALGQVVGGALMLNSGLQSMFDLFNSGEKDISKYVGSLMMIIPALGMMYAAIAKVVGGIYASIVAQKTKVVIDGVTMSMSAAKAAGYSAEAIAAGVATAATMGLNAAMIPLLPIIIAVTAALAILVGLFAWYSNNQKKAREEAIAGAEASSKAAEANLELRDSLYDVKDALQDAHKELEVGNISLEEYAEKVAEVRAELVKMMEEDPSFRINLMEFDASTPIQQLEMLQKAVEEKNVAIIDQAEKTREYVRDLYGDGLVSDKELDSDKGVEALKDSMSQLPEEIQKQVKTAEGYWDLQGIADNWDDLMQGMTQTQQTHFQEMMSNMDGFTELLGSASAEQAAIVNQNYLKMQQSTDPNAFLNLVEAASSAEALKTENEEILSALEDRSRILESELESLKSKLDIAYQTGYSDIPITELQEQIKIVEGNISLVEKERRAILDKINDKVEAAGMSYAELGEEIARTGTEEEKQMMAAINALAAATGRSQEEIASAAKQSSKELDDALALIKANRNELIGLSGEFQLVVNLALEEQSIQGIKNKISELKEEMTAKERITWLDEMNEQIETMNKNIALTGGEPLAKLDEGFFSMSQNVREAYLATLEQEQATRTLVNAQEQLQAAQNAQTTILQKAVDLTGDQTIKSKEALDVAITNAEIELAATQANHLAAVQAIQEEERMRQEQLAGALESARIAQEARAAAGKDTSKEDAALAEAQKQFDAHQQTLQSREDAIEVTKKQQEEDQKTLDQLRQMKEDLDTMTAQEREAKIKVDDAFIDTLNEAERAVYNYDQALKDLEDADTPEKLAASVKGLEKSWDDLVKATADGIGIDEDVLADYSKHIMRTAKASDLLSDSLADNQKMALKVAAATIRANEGYGKLESNLDNIKETIKGINKNEIDIGSQRAMEDINALDEALSDILNIDTGQLSLEFLTSEESIRLAEAALNGVEGALWNLQQAAATSILQNMFPEEDLTSLDMLQGQFAELVGAIDTAAVAGWQLGQELGSIEGIGNLVTDIQANASEIVRQMQNMGASAEQVQAYFNSMGMEIEGDKETVTTKKTIDTTDTVETLTPFYTTVRQPKQNADGSWSYTPVTYTGMNRSVKTVPGTEEIEVEQEVFSFTGKDGNGGFTGTMTSGASLTNISSGGTKAGSAMAAPANRGGGGRGTGGSGGGGGGGGGSEPKVITAERKDHTDRFRDINDALAEVARRMEKVNNASDKAFGLNKLRLLAANNSLLQEQAKLYDKLRKEAQNYLNVSGGQAVKFGESYMSTQGGDKATLNRMLKQLGGVEAGFTDDDFVKNAEEVMNSLYAMQAQKAAEFGGVMNETTGLITFATDEAGEEQKKLWEEWLAMVEAVNGQIERVNEAAQTAADALAEGLANIHDWLSNKIAEVDLKLELRMRINEMDLRQINFLIDRLSDRAANISMDLFTKGAEEAIDNGHALIAAYSRLEQIMGNINNIDEWKTGDHQEWFKEQFGPEAWEEFIANGGAMTQEMIDSLIDKAGQMQDVIDQLYDYSEKMFGSFRRLLDVYLADFDRLLATYDNHTTILDSWKEIWMIAGTPFKNTRMEIDLMNKSIDNQVSKVKGLQQQQQFLEGQIGNARRVYEAALAAHGADDRITEEAYQSWKDLEAQAAETAATVMSETAAMAQMFEDLTIRAAEIIRSEFQGALSGMYADFEGLSAMFSQRQTMDKFFMHEEDLGLELGKLLEQTLAEPEGLKDAAKWEEYLGSLIEKRIVQTEVLGEMREHEVWVAKDGVQLTEKQLKIIQEQFELEKQQAAFQEQQEMKKTMRLARDASGNWSYIYSADQEPEADKAQEIEDRLANIRQMHREAVDELTNFWVEQMLEWEEFEANVDQRRYAQDEKYKAQVDAQRAWYQEMLGTLASQVEIHLDAIDMDFTETTLSTILNLDDMSEANDLYTENITNMSIAFRDNWQENQEQLHDRLEEMGIDMDNFENTVQEETDKIMAKNKENEQSIIDLRSTAEQELGTMTSKIEDWSQRWQTEIATLIARLQDLIDKIREVAAEQAGADSTYNANVDYSARIAKKSEENDKYIGSAEHIADETARWWKMHDLEMDNLEAALENWYAMGGTLENWDRHQEWYQASGGAKGGMSAGGMTLEEYLKSRIPGYLIGGLAKAPQFATLAEDGKRELVLNNSDTENFLAAIQIMRDSIQGHLASLGMKQAGIINGVHSTTSETTNNQTPVIIQADFPNVSAREEIEAAFANLVNQAAQYQLKPRG